MDLRRRHEGFPSNLDRSEQQLLQLQRPISKSMKLQLKQEKLAYRLVFGVLTMMVLLLLSLHGNDDAVQLKHSQQNQKTLMPLVCSHQILNPPALQQRGVDSEYFAANGSLDAMTALFQSGVHCFDVDVITLSDGTLLASHPRRLEAAVRKAKVKAIETVNAMEAHSNEINDNHPFENQTNPDIRLEDFTLEYLFQTLGLDRSKESNSKQINIRGSNFQGNSNSISPFPLFDKDILPHFAGLVRGIPGAFSPVTAASEPSSVAPWILRGPLLNIDLKQGPYLTKEKVLELARQIHALQLEDYVAVCVVESGGNSESKDIDLLEIMHKHNTATQTNSRRIPLTLVLRDLVPQDANVNHIRHLVEDLYPESIKSLVPSFKFSLEWFQEIRRKEVGQTSMGRQSSMEEKDVTNRLWKLPMSVWTIDSREEYDFVTSRTAVILDEDSDELMTVPMASAVVANSPMELVAREQSILDDV